MDRELEKNLMEINAGDVDRSSQKSLIGDTEKSNKR